LQAGLDVALLLVREQNRTQKGTMGEFTFQGQGTLQRIDTFVSKAGKTILTLICETQGSTRNWCPSRCSDDSPSSVCLEAGSVLSVSGRLGGRDWQGKVYGESWPTPSRSSAKAPRTAAAR